MDMQTKVIFITGEPSYRKATELSINEKDYPEFYLGEEFVVFSEHTRAGVQLSSHVSSTYMTIETYDEEELVYIYPNGEEYVLSLGREGENMVVPGYYEINIYTGGKAYHGFYKVEPSTVSWEGLMEIRNVLEDLMNGLAQNLYLRKMGKQGEYVTQDPSLIEMHEHIINNEHMLINCIDSLVKDPITNITKEYREQSYSSFLDMKSQKWLSKKGMTINSNPYLPEFNYEKHSVLSVDTVENRWIKKILHHTITVIVKLENAYGKIFERTNREVKEKKRKYNESAVQYNNAVKQKYLARRYMYRLGKRLRILEEDIERDQKKVKSIQEVLGNLKRIKTTIAHYEYETWLGEITGYEKMFKPSLKLIKEHRCLQLYTFYRKLLLMEKNRHGKKTSFPFKKTSLLFEYYTVGVVINILELLGYRWEKGWLADSIDPMLFNGELPRETEMIFKKDNLYLELAYDKDVKSEPDNPTKNQIVSINSTHTRPDITITAYNEIGELLGCIIIEVKCSKSEYIYNRNGDTRAVEQIKDYINFGYYDAEEESYLPGGVNKVILVYPKQPHSINYPTRFNFSFIQLDPADENSGCEDLRRELGLLLNGFEEKGMETGSFSYHIMEQQAASHSREPLGQIP